MYEMTLNDCVEFWGEFANAVVEIADTASKQERKALKVQWNRALELWSIYGQMPDECYKPGQMNEDLFKCVPWAAGK